MIIPYIVYCDVNYGNILGHIDGQWSLANVNQNCVDACSSLNLTCSEEEFHKHNSDIDSSNEVFRLIKTLGGTIKARSWCEGHFGSSPGVPAYSATYHDCFYSDPSRTVSTFDCRRLPLPKSHNKRRICWCHEPG